MHPNLRQAQFLLFGLLTLFISGCASNSTITHSYIDPNVHKLNLKGVLVIAVTQKMPARINFEDAFVSALKRRGATAVASHTLLPGKNPTEEEVIAAATAANLDTVLVTRYIGKREQEIYHPGTIYYGVAPVYAPGFGGYYGHAYEVAYQQPVYSSNVTFTLISDLFATDGKEHLWQAVSDTIKAGGTNKLRDDVISGFVGNMKDEGLFN